MITKLSQLDLNKKYSYAEYLTWKLSERVELIKGRIFKMSPAPNLFRQKISGIIFGEIWQFLKGHRCQAFHAPFDVRLPMPANKRKDHKINTVVQPDITVICDEKKLDKRGCIGAPDLVVEILSPGNTKKEMKDKFDIYQNAGIKEYWLVDPEHEFAIIYTLNKKGKYIGSSPYTAGMTITSKVLSGFELLEALLFCCRLCNLFLTFWNCLEIRK